MARLKFRKAIKSIVRTSTDGPTRIYRRKRSRAEKDLRPMEKVIIKLVKEQRRAADRYLVRHRDSNDSERNGWALDYSRNVVKSYRKLDQQWLRHAVFNRPV